MRTDKVVVYILWFVILKVAVWTVIAAGYDWIGDDTVRLALVVMIPVTGLTAVLHVRLFAVRMCSLIRATHGLDRGRQPEIRAVP